MGEYENTTASPTTTTSSAVPTTAGRGSAELGALSYDEASAALSPTGHPHFIEMNKEMRREIEDMFPGLNESNWACLEWKDNGAYNCFAWALGITDRHVKGFPDVNPNGGPSLEDWDRYMAGQGYGSVTAGMNTGADILLYSTGDLPEHAARKSDLPLPAGGAVFTSKLGPGQLIAHTPTGLEGGSYGSVIRSYSAG